MSFINVDAAAERDLPLGGNPDNPLGLVASEKSSSVIFLV